VPLKQVEVIPPHDPQTGEVLDIPPALDRRPKKPELATASTSIDWIKFGQGYIAAVKEALSLDAVMDMEASNRANLDAMQQDAPKVYARMKDAIAAHIAETWPKAEPEVPF
jgi:hypothetical protein